MSEAPRVVNLADVSTGDHALVGGKASKLGEVVRQGLPVPPGVVVTTRSYAEFVDGTGIGPAITAALARIDPERPETVEPASRQIRELFEQTEFPAALRTTLVKALEGFEKEHAVAWCAVRSSATAEDLEGASFAGLQETYLNVRGTEAILSAVRRCWGSLFTPRVLVYRAKKGYDHASVELAVLVQKMVDSTVSGILFTRDPNTGENHM
ncbi:MAG TPA: PEP/pyruvate-binding domain-containing protein, partial [Thermoplasmata archaeon]|nr:PEP/pyruvate-binding domain-containing protein [Thermoplasmata archaeon]